ncbi:MAG: hypothetical protein ACYC27_00880 [Armatimonadota bacterium]
MDKQLITDWVNTGPIEIKMVEKHEKCKHNLGDTFYYRNPYNKPDGVCHALLHVIDLYIWRVALDFPSWEDDDNSVYRIHCPAKNGTVWEIRKSTIEE